MRIEIFAEELPEEGGFFMTWRMRVGLWVVKIASRLFGWNFISEVELVDSETHE